VFRRLRQAISAWVGGLRPAKPLGRRGEEEAARYLRQRGWRILARSDRLKPGELDLVALDGQTVVFVEVKARTSAQSGHPSEAVGADKQRRLTRLALAYLKRHRLLDSPARFDVVAVTWPAGQAQPTIEHLQGAFEAVGPGGFYS